MTEEPFERSSELEAAGAEGREQHIEPAAPDGEPALQQGDPATGPVATAAAEKWPFWGYRDLAILIGFFVASFLVVVFIGGMIVAAVPALKDKSFAGPFTIVLQVAVYGLAYLSLHFTLASRYRRPVMRSLGWKMPRTSLWLAAVAGLLLPVVISVLLAPFHPPKIESPFEKFAISRPVLVCFGIMAAVLAPLMEELVFRGFLQPLLQRDLGVALGVFLTALLFGILHGPEYSWAWQYVAAVTMAGIAFGAMRTWSDSTLAAAVMHGGFNLVMVAGMMFRFQH